MPWQADGGHLPPDSTEPWFSAVALVLGLVLLIARWWRPGGRPRPHQASEPTAAGPMANGIELPPARPEGRSPRLPPAVKAQRSGSATVPGSDRALTAPGAGPLPPGRPAPSPVPGASQGPANGP